MGARMVESDDTEAGSNVGVLVEDNVLEVGAGDGMLDLVCRDGLRSCWLFFRDRVPVPVPVDAALETAARRVGRVGEGSREGSGEARDV